ncbi:MAG TPA: hypothetical protein VGZ25_02840 [Gemmataceae bacterium]|nr:hypothetical protein [Gemmataceae bacterium]
MANVTYQDQVVIYRVITSKVMRARRFLRQFKSELKMKLRQEEILIIEREVAIL